MKTTSWIKVALVSIGLAGAVAVGCGGGTTPTMTTQRATSRVIRGRVPVRTGNRRITRVVAINAKTRATIGSATPAADGTYVINNIPVGAVYRLQAIAGRTSIPIVFPKAPSMAAKTNLFRVGTKNSRRAGTIDGPIDTGELGSTMDSGEEQLQPMNPMQAPNLQEDYDEDGMPDATDSDVDGDGMPNEMDTDNDGDGMPDNAQVGDQDGDGLTNESDPDMDGDGMPNAMDADNDNDGTPDAMDTTPNGDEGANAEDRDGDGVPNSEDSMAPDDNVPEEGTDGGTETDASVAEDGGGEGDGGT